ncbi:hypothetical protein U1Q18_025592, partial [Sarracenia purpurea var. burkii]
MESSRRESSKEEEGEGEEEIDVYDEERSDVKAVVTSVAANTHEGQPGNFEEKSLKVFVSPVASELEIMAEDSGDNVLSSFEKDQVNDLLAVGSVGKVGPTEFGNLWEGGKFNSIFGGAATRQNDNRVNLVDSSLFMNVQ